MSANNQELIERFQKVQAKKLEISELQIKFKTQAETLERDQAELLNELKTSFGVDSLEQAQTLLQEMTAKFESDLTRLETVFASIKIGSSS